MLTEDERHVLTYGQQLNSINISLQWDNGTCITEEYEEKDNFAQISRFRGKGKNWLNVIHGVTGVRDIKI